MNEHWVIGEGTPVHRSASGAHPQRTCILVLGMHRSGTSAVTRVLSLLGAALPKNLLGAGPGNETGHWEPLRLINVHDQMLAEAGSRWDDWRKLDLTVLPPARLAHYKAEIGRLIAAECGDARLIVLKEPRICRFVTFYTELLAEQGCGCLCVLPLRNPLAVIASLARRDGMNEGFAALLWLRHVLDTEAATRGKTRALVSYEALLVEWQKPVRLLGARLGLPWPRPFEEIAADVEAFLSDEHQHFAPSRRELLERRDIAAWVQDSYAALLRLERDPDDEAAFDELDRVRAEFDAACPAFGTAMFPELAVRERKFAAELGRVVGEAASVRATLALREGDLAMARADISLQDQSIGELRATLAKRDENIASMRGGFASLEQMFAELRSAVAMRDDDIASMGGGIANLQQMFGELRTTAIVAHENIVGLQGEIANLEEMLSQLRTTLAVRDADRATLEREQTRLTQVLRDANAELARERDVSRTDREMHRHALNAVYASTSWLITGPLRGLKRITRHPTALALNGARAAVQRLPIRMETKLKIKTFILRKQFFRDALALAQQRSEARASKSQTDVAMPTSSASGANNSLFADYTTQILEICKRKVGTDLEYVPRSDEVIDFSRLPLRVVAFYLPQFHPIPENDAWWGKGSTEWTNVSKAVPQYVGHYQPRLPGDLGFYDLRLLDVMRQQVELAKRYGVGAFCFHYYWFAGKRLLEKPVNQFLAART